MLSKLNLSFVQMANPEWFYHNPKLLGHFTAIASIFIAALNRTKGIKGSYRQHRENPMAASFLHPMWMANFSALVLLTIK